MHGVLYIIFIILSFYNINFEKVLAKQNSDSDSS